MYWINITSVIIKRFSKLLKHPVVYLFQKYTLIILLLTLSGKVNAQVLNSFANDKTGMYYYSIDTLIDIARSKEKLKRVVIIGEQQITSTFPDKINQMPIRILASGEKMKKATFTGQDVIFTLKPPTINQAQITINILTSKWNGKGFSLFEQGVYTFYFLYQPKANSYILEKITGGM